MNQTKNTIPVVLSIAGSDSGGGAGIQADIKTFAALGVHCATAITSVTAQNPREVKQIYDLDAAAVETQIKAVLEYYPVAVVKTGMLSNGSIVSAAARILKPLKNISLIVDPVMISTSGAKLLQDDAVDAMVEELIPIATVITPNIFEAERLAGIKINNRKNLEKAFQKLKSLGPEYIIIKGGHHWDETKADDYLYDGKSITEIRGKRIINVDTHGSGCTFSAALAAYFALGLDITSAARKAKVFIEKILSKSVGQFEKQQL